MSQALIVFKNNSESLLLYPRHFEKFLPVDGIENSKIYQSIQWRQNPITVFGKQYLEPRLTAWMGPAYRYSNIQWESAPFNPSILPLKQVLAQTLGFDFNSCLLNYYRHGQDSMGKHRDNEPEMDTRTIASVSFGATRKIRFTHLKTNEKIALSLTHGDLLIMQNFQENWVHEVPKMSKSNPRLNLTFRNIIK
jgi:alkylated DNA repair dioxygenase AlkB